MTATRAPGAASCSTTEIYSPALSVVHGGHPVAFLVRAAFLTGCALALVACTSTGSSPPDAGVHQNAETPLVAGSDYDAQIADPGDGVVDASVVVGSDDPLAPIVTTLDVASPEKPDLWQRSRARFVLELEDRPRLEREKAWFQRNQKYMDRVSDRARLYLHHIVSEVERRNLPGELAMLPVVESAYQPFAYSPARASGIWQFIPSTGRHYGLRY
ncbi:MAG: transglycosylase SLT domain-containing protein, partial [Proteobacteria bacterium]|nr:transglycosylase SLT domain-containing protein [Pseudomonadota bacterium]